MNFFIYTGRGEKLTKLREGSPFYDGVEVGISDRSWPHELSLSIGVEAGRPVLNRIMIARARGSDGTYIAKPLTTKSLSIPLERIVRDAFEGVGRLAAGRSGSTWADELASGRAAGVRKRKDLTDGFLQNVAAIARANPDTPTKAVAAELHTVHRNATRWIAAARRRGFLKEDR